MLAAIGRLEAAFDGSQRGGHVDLTAMRSGLTDFNADLAGMRAEIGRLERAFDISLRDVRADMIQMRSAIMDRIDRLQDRVTEVRDEIGVAMGSADAMQRANDNTRELVRLQGEQMSIMFRQLKRIEEKVRNITGDN
jgi:hypothetical protein